MPAAIMARRRKRSIGRRPAPDAARSASISPLSTMTDPNADRKPPKVISPSDPSSAWTAKANKRVQFGYGLNYLIDIENAVIVDVEATPARTYDEVEATKTMIERTEQRFGLKPEAPRWRTRPTGPASSSVGWSGTGITPHIPVWEKSEREDGIFSRSDFTLGQTRGRIHLPERQGPADQRHGSRRSDDALSGQQARLRCMSVEGASAARTSLRAKYRATSTRMPATSRVGR